ncbi:hypothetical protein Q428_05170 [Fervidicella metallireducens AeB]|uniref:DUF7847 domain-containing protein n=1 Tax=Fervidicella metallireducens AeB TaxID=1403537 RepID=A0A017RVY6_9CLOT|nr:hypothetical protein [Fervidicella metallireducens]EYE88943.1 hypothetical protein Q428_05170 [Fervidicella metallireducens AeB]
MGIMSFAEVMDESIEILKKHFKTIVLFKLAYGVVYMMAAVVLSIAGVLIISLFSGFSSGSNFPNIVVMVILGVFFLSIITSLALSSNIGVIKIAGQRYTDEEIYTAEALKYSFRSILRVFGIVIITIILLIPAAIVFGGLLYFLYKNYKYIFFVNMSFDLNGIFPLILLVILFLVGTMVFTAYTTWLGFSLHAVAIENKGVIESVERSFYLVKNNFWRLFKYGIIIFLSISAIQFSISSLFGIILSLFYLVLKLLNMQQDVMAYVTLAATYIRWPLNLISWLLTSPIGTIMTTLIYFNQRFIKEGFDVEIMISKLERERENNKSREVIV